MMKFCCWTASSLVSKLGSRGCDCDGSIMAVRITGGPEQISTRATLEALSALCPWIPLLVSELTAAPLRREPGDPSSALPGMAGTVPIAGITGMGAGIIAGWYPDICIIPGYTKGDR